MRLTERRRARRFKLRLPLCRIYPEVKGFLAMRDISLTGARVEGKKLPGLGSEIRLFLGNCDAMQAVAFGKVIRIDLRTRREFAVEFLGPDPRFLRAAIEWS